MATRKTAARRKSTARKAATKAQCLVPGCDRPERCRGMCGPCRATATGLVDKGETTDDELIAKGWLLPAAGTRASPLVTALHNTKARAT